MNSANNNKQTYVDTIYYNSDWKVVNYKMFADYYRVKVNSTNQKDRHFRDYYITGELYAKGEYVKIDSLDDNKSVFNGEYTAYRKNGLVEKNAKFINGRMDGVYTEFRENGLCMQIEYQKGRNDGTYIVSNQDGCLMRYSIDTNQPIWESPKISERKTEYRDGKPWPYYNKNGIIVTMSNTQVKDYGKYYKIVIVITNNSLVPIEFDPIKNITPIATREQTGNRKYARVLSSEEYMKKVRRSQNWQAAAVAFSAAVASYNAGYSSSTTVTNRYSSGSASAYGTRGSAYGSYVGALTTLTNTRNYDAFAAYQAQIIAQNRVASFGETLNSERKIKEEGYLKKTTINPSEAIIGYVNIDRKYADQYLEIVVNINEAEYVFNWSNY